MNEYEIFKKWVNSFDEKIYYKIKPPTKKELYEIAIKQEEEIERLKEMKLNTEKYASEMEDKYILEKNKNNKAIEFLDNECLYDEDLGYCDDLWCGRVQELVNILKGDDKE